MSAWQAISRRRKKDIITLSGVTKDHTTNRNIGILVYSYLWQILVNMYKNSGSF
jgi:hypothetical protein